MISSTAVLGTVGVILLTVLGTGLADHCNNPSTQETIRVSLINQLNSGSDGEVVFKELNGGSLVDILPSVSKTDICNELTTLHNTVNVGFLGVGITSSKCQAAFSSPAPATLGDLAGIHCFQAGTPVADDAEWATPTAPLVTQSMTYFHRGSPCCYPFNRIVSGNKIIGYDPLDNVAGYNCEQGTYVAYPFTVSAEVDCMLKVTGTSAFLECLNNGSKKRTSAGYFGGYYAHYKVKPLGSTCP